MAVGAEHRRNITGDQLHNLVWSQVDRLLPRRGVGSPQLAVRARAAGTAAERTGNEITDTPGLVTLQDKEVIIVDWSPRQKTGFDVSAIERREDDASMPGREG